MFPDTLVEPMLDAGCPIGGAVLDPFSGMGTVGVVAARLGMDFIGIELSEEYAGKAEERIAGGTAQRVKDKQAGYGRTHAGFNDRWRDKQK
jgi:DNA modification methylase